MSSANAQPRNSLRAVVAAAIDAGLRHGDELQSDKTREVDLLAGLFTRGLDELRANLPRVLRPVGLECRIHAVYCHQSPKVRSGRGVCELGDLLIATRYQHGPRAANRALLLQLKVDGRGRPSKAQAALYERWPLFDYVAYPHAQRKVKQPIPHPGAQWGQIGLCPACEGACRCGFGVTLKAELPCAASTREASYEITDMILGAGGRGFSERDVAERGKDWSRVIWDLLETTGRKLLNYKRAQLIEENRGREISLMRAHGIQSFVQGVPWLMRASALRDEDDFELLGVSHDDLTREHQLDDRPPDEPPPWEEQWENRPDGGISLLLFDVGPAVDPEG